MRTRRELEEIEDRTLAPYAMRSARSAGRDHPEAEHAYRTVYQRDRDRIIHCAAFRRLEYKTQVFVNSEGDSYRTRLTHTIEVAQIARTIARALGLNEDLVEALALVHDLGHGPFGHAGEHALAQCMKELDPNGSGFEHNVQGLRIVEKLEARYPSFQGLNLSYETREGMAKHGDYLKKGSAARFHPEARPFLEALAADTADRLAYNHHDLDDGLTSGILAEREVRELPHIDAAFAAVDADRPGLPQRVRINQAFIRLMNESVSDLVAATSERLADAKVKSVDDVRASKAPLVGFSDAGAKRHEEMHAWLYARFYSHWKVARMQETAKRFLRTVFVAYVENPRTLPPDVSQRRETDGLHRAVCDFVASMTDRELHAEYRRIALP